MWRARFIFPIIHYLWFLNLQRVLKENSEIFPLLSYCNLIKLIAIEYGRLSLHLFHETNYYFSVTWIKRDRYHPHGYWIPCIDLQDSPMCKESRYSPRCRLYFAVLCEDSCQAKSRQGNRLLLISLFYHYCGNHQPVTISELTIKMSLINW